MLTGVMLRPKNPNPTHRHTRGQFTSMHILRFSFLEDEKHLKQHFKSTDIKTIKTKHKLNSLKASPRTECLHMHSGGVDFSQTDGVLSGLSRPPRGRGGVLHGVSRMDGWIKGKRREGDRNMTGVA